MRSVLVVEAENGEQTLQKIKLKDICDAVDCTFTDHYMLRASVPFLKSVMILYVGDSMLCSYKPVNRVAMKLMIYLQNVCTVMPMESCPEIRGRAVLCVENGQLNDKAVSLIQRIIGSKRERQLPPEVDTWIAERENRDVNNFPPALQTMHQLLTPKRDHYGVIQ